MRPAAAMYGTHEEGAATRQLMERAMAEAKRIRLEALATAEQGHRALTEATHMKCDEMLAAAREEAAAIVDGARREAQRLRAQAAVEAPIPLAKGTQTSAHMVLEMAFDEAEQMVAKAAEDAERVRESLIADAHASAMEILRNAEIESSDRMREARQRLEILREQTKQIYDRLCDVTGEFADRQANADALKYAPGPESEFLAAGNADSMDTEPNGLLQEDPDTRAPNSEPAADFAEETPDMHAAMADQQEPVSVEYPAGTAESTLAQEMESPTSEEDRGDWTAAPEETATARDLAVSAADAPADAEDADDDLAEAAQVEEQVAEAATAEDNAESLSEPEVTAVDEAAAPVVGTSLARWKPNHRVALTLYTPATHVWHTTSPAATVAETDQPYVSEPGPELLSSPVQPFSAAAPYESYEEVVPAATTSDDSDGQPQPIGLLAQRLSVQGDEGERLRSESTDRIFGLQARLRDSLATNATSGEHGGFRRFLNRQSNS